MTPAEFVEHCRIEKDVLLELFMATGGEILVSPSTPPAAAEGIAVRQDAMVGGVGDGGFARFANGFVKSGLLKGTLNVGLSRLAGAVIAAGLMEAMRARNDCGCGK